MSRTVRLEELWAQQSARPGATVEGLTWSCDREPGIRRVRRGRGFSYRDPQGRPITDPHVLARIRGLAVPPAYQQVWICMRANGHLQATGLDARGRKQYRYHPQWQAARGETKFDRLTLFGRVLPRIRSRAQRVLAAAEEPTRSRLLATLARLLDTTWMRIGNAEYARSNASYGLTTLQNRHVDLRGGELRLSFAGKSGVRHDVRVSDRRVVAVMRRLRELPGQELFRYLDGAGNAHRIDSSDVNAWLAEAAGQPVTAKDFRTWHASVLALDLTLAAASRGAMRALAQHVAGEVARRLGNTAAVCRKSYIHPAVLALASDFAAGHRPDLAWAQAPPTRRGLSLAERRLLALLRSRAGSTTSASSTSRSRTTSSRPTARRGPMRCCGSDAELPGLIAASLAAAETGTLLAVKGRSHRCPARNS